MLSRSIFASKALAFQPKGQAFSSAMRIPRNALTLLPNYKKQHEEVEKKAPQKHKVPQRRASSMLNLLKKEEFEKLKNGRNYPQIQAGDSIQIEKSPFMSSTEIDVIKGVVIGVVNRASDSSVKMLNVEHGTPIYRNMLLYSPLVKNVKILQKAFIHKGKKRVKRSKLYYLEKRHPDNFTVV